MAELTVFNYRTMDEDLIQDFEDFIEYNNLLPLFTNEHRVKNISIGHNEMIGVLKVGGNYRTDLTEFADLIAMSNDNKMYESSMMEILHDAGSFQQFMKRVRKISQYIKHVIGINHLFNTWNIVWYTKEVY